MLDKINKMYDIVKVFNESNLNLICKKRNWDICKFSFVKKKKRV